MNSSLVDICKSLLLGFSLVAAWMGCAAVVGAVKGRPTRLRKVSAPIVVMGEPRVVEVGAEVRVAPKLKFSGLSVEGPVEPCVLTREPTTELIDSASSLIEEVHEMQVHMEVLTDEVE